MIAWVQFAVASYILNSIGIRRFFTRTGKLFLGFWIVFIATVVVSASADLFSTVSGLSSIPFGSFLVAAVLIVGSLYWFHQDGQRNDRFFNEYAGGSLFSFYTLKSVVGLSTIAVSFVIEPIAIVPSVLVAIWLVWRYEWVGRPHGIISFGILLGAFSILSPMSPGNAMGISISLIASAVVSNRYSPDETGWSRGHPKWLWRFNWKKRMQLPVEPHPGYEGSVVNDCYPDDEDDLSEDDGDHTPDNNREPSQSQTARDGNSGASNAEASQSHVANPNDEPDTTQPDRMTTQNPTADQQQEQNRQRQKIIEEKEFEWEEPPEKRFENIGGYGGVKDQLREEVVLPVRDDNPGFDRYGIEPTRGVLFYGPPGTGKTMFARALANELNKPFVELSQADLTSEYINEGPQLVADLFDEAQTLGGVVFIDEAEQLLSKRSGRNQHNEDQKVMNTFLSALSKDDQQFIVILTTNRRDLMDEAILRPGRVDREIEIGMPNEEARLKILKTKLADMPHSLSVNDIKDMVRQTRGWSGADLDSLIVNARREAAIENAPQIRRCHIDLESVDRA